MTDLSTGIDEEMAAHLRGQSVAHGAIAAGLGFRAVAELINTDRAATALARSSVHAEFARRYHILAARIAAGDIDWTDTPAVTR